MQETFEHLASHSTRYHRNFPNTEYVHSVPMSTLQWSHHVSNSNYKKRRTVDVKINFLLYNVHIHNNEKLSGKYNVTCNVIHNARRRLCKYLELCVNNWWFPYIWDGPFGMLHFCILYSSHIACRRRIRLFWSLRKLKCFFIHRSLYTRRCISYSQE